MKKLLERGIFPAIAFLVTLSLSLVFLGGFAPFWVILLASALVAVGLALMFGDQPIILGLTAQIIERFTPRSTILLTASLASLFTLAWFVHRITYWFMNFGTALFLATGIWAYYFWWKYGENWFRYTEQNTLEISGNAIIRHIDPEKSQRTLFAGLNVMIPGIDNVDGKPISTKWIQIELTEKFSAQSLDGVEVSFEGCFQRMRILGDKAVAFNNHGVEEATRAFVARMEAFLTDRIALINHDDVRSLLGILCSEFAAVYPSSRVDSLESIYGVETQEIQISGVIFPTEVEAANRIGMIMRAVSKQVQDLVKLSGESIQWKEALFYVMSMMGKMTGDLGIFAAFGNMFGNNKKEKNQQQNQRQQPKTK